MNLSQLPSLPESTVRKSNHLVNGPVLQFPETHLTKLHERRGSYHTGIPGDTRASLLKTGMASRKSVSNYNLNEIQNGRPVERKASKYFSDKDHLYLPGTVYTSSNLNIGSSMKHISASQPVKKMTKKQFDEYHRKKALQQSFSSMGTSNYQINQTGIGRGSGLRQTHSLKHRGKKF